MLSSGWEYIGNLLISVRPDPSGSKITGTVGALFKRGVDKERSIDSDAAPSAPSAPSLKDIGLVQCALQQFESMFADLSLVCDYDNMSEMARTLFEGFVPGKHRFAGIDPGPGRNTLVVLSKDESRSLLYGQWQSTNDPGYRYDRSTLSLSNAQFKKQGIPSNSGSHTRINTIRRNSLVDTRREEYAKDVAEMLMRENVSHVFCGDWALNQNKHLPNAQNRGGTTFCKKLLDALKSACQERNIQFEYVNEAYTSTFYYSSFSGPVVKKLDDVNSYRLRARSTGVNQNQVRYLSEKAVYMSKNTPETNDDYLRGSAPSNLIHQTISGNNTSIDNLLMKYLQARGFAVEVWVRRVLALCLGREKVSGMRGMRYMECERWNLCANADALVHLPGNKMAIVEIKSTQKNLENCIVGYAGQLTIYMAVYDIPHAYVIVKQFSHNNPRVRPGWIILRMDRGDSDFENEVFEDTTDLSLNERSLKLCTALMAREGGLCGFEKVGDNDPVAMAMSTKVGMDTKFLELVIASTVKDVLSLSADVAAKDVSLQKLVNPVRALKKADQNYVDRDEIAALTIAQNTILNLVSFSKKDGTTISVDEKKLAFSMKNSLTEQHIRDNPKLQKKNRENIIRKAAKLVAVKNLNMESFKLTEELPLAHPSVEFDTSRRSSNDDNYEAENGEIVEGEEAEGENSLVQPSVEFHGFRGSSHDDKDEAEHGEIREGVETCTLCLLSGAPNRCKNRGHGGRCSQFRRMTGDTDETANSRRVLYDVESAKMQALQSFKKTYESFTKRAKVALEEVGISRQRNLQTDNSLSSHPAAEEEVGRPVRVKKGTWKVQENLANVDT